MSEVILRIRPGESVDEFTSRVAASAPHPPPDVLDRIRALLVPDAERQPVPAAPRDEQPQAA